ncbi:MAG TPA: exosortase/archaeosortase family protein [Armatimonadota bacterium]|nr:exosortase/archaeosortase family protein [Armatimonadota bacterium]
MSDTTAKPSRTPEEKAARDTPWRVHAAFAFAVLLLCLWYRDVFDFWRSMWFAEDGYYSHAPLVPWLTAFLVWMRRAELAETTPRATLWGVPVLLLGGVLKLTATRLSLTGVESLAGIAFPVLLWALILGIYGTGVARILTGPAAFLWLMCPLPGYLLTELSFPLQLLSTTAAVNLVNAGGVSALQDGTSIQLGTLSLYISGACSGFKSVCMLLTLSAFAAGTSRIGLLRKGILFLAAIPIGLVANACRIALIALMVSYRGETAARLAHTWSGLLMLALAGLSIYVMAKVLEWLEDTNTW